MIITILRFLLRILDLLLLAYCVCSFIIPENQYYLMLKSFFDRLLNPIRNFLWKISPKVRRLPVDVSPLVLFLLIGLLSALLGLLQ